MASQLPGRFVTWHTNETVTLLMSEVGTYSIAFPSGFTLHMVDKSIRIPKVKTIKTCAITRLQMCFMKMRQKQSSGKTIEHVLRI